jgi:hypothetical protein
MVVIVDQGDGAIPHADLSLKAGVSYTFEVVSYWRSEMYDDGQTPVVE